MSSAFLDGIEVVDLSRKNRASRHAKSFGSKSYRLFIHTKKTLVTEKAGQAHENSLAFDKGSFPPTMKPRSIQPAFAEIARKTKPTTVTYFFYLHLLQLLLLKYLARKQTSELLLQHSCVVLSRFSNFSSLAVNMRSSEKVIFEIPQQSDRVQSRLQNLAGGQYKD